MEKVTVPKEVAEAIEGLRDQGTTISNIFRMVEHGVFVEEVHPITKHFRNDLDELMRALVIGYQVEQTPEEKLREYYDNIKRLSEKAHAEADHDYESEMLSEMLGIKTTVDILGISIEGINA